MDSSDTAHLLYLVILLGVIGFYHVVANRRHMARMLRHVALWALIFIGVLASIGLWQDMRPRLAPAQIIHGDGVIEIDRDSSGHYIAFADINGQTTEFLVDTGASNIVLSRSDAQAAGFDLDSLVFSGRAKTANGVVQTASVLLETVEFGGVKDSDVRAYITDGELFSSLLGMDYLSRFEKIEIQRGTLILTR